MTIMMVTLEPSKSVAVQANSMDFRYGFDELMGKLLQKVPQEKYDCNALASVPFYNLPPLIGFKNHDVSRPKAPAARILGRPPIVGSFEDSPGPGAYDLREKTRFGSATTLKARILGRPRNTEYEKDVPGPGAYMPKSVLTVPSLPRAVLMGRPRDVKHTEDTPGPGDYKAEPVLGMNLPRYPNPRAASIKSRPKAIGFYAEAGPGPGKYDYNLNNFMKKTPSAPLGGRAKELVVISGGPAPNAYYPQTNTFKSRAPSFSFGNRQSKCMTVVIEEDDNDHFVEYQCQ